jgi:RHS repeat-associated protein
VTHPDGELTHIAYGAAVTALGGLSAQQSSAYGVGFPVLSVDEAGNLRQEWLDGFGRVIEVDEPSVAGKLTSPLFTNYTYDALGNLISVVQGAQSRTYQHDGLSRLTQEVTPEAGKVTLSYLKTGGTLCSGNPLNPCTKTDARGIVTTYAYDTANRLTGKTHVPTTTGAETYTYGTSATPYSIGRLLTMTDPSGSETYTYDQMGHVTELAKVIGSTTYTIKYVYNTGGQLTQITYPSGRNVYNVYDNVGHLCLVSAVSATSCSSTSPYLTIASSGYDAANRPLTATYGNAIVATAAYSPQRSQLTSLSYAKGTTKLFNLNYYYQQVATNCPKGNAVGNNGQVQCIVDSVQSGRSATYVYDFLGRLSTAATTGSTSYPAWSVSETYDRYGNRSAQSVTAGTAPAPSFGINAATNQINTGGYTYDAAGHLTAEPWPFSGTYSYDGEDCLTNFTGNGNTATYTCDGNHLRVKKVTNTVTTVSIYSGGHVIAEYDNGAAVTSPTREYIYGHNLLATVTGSTSGSGGTIVYQHRDHLSPRLYTNSTGGDSGEQGTYPFGEPWYNNNTTSNWVFTTYERDAESGIDYALARSYYSSEGRFMSPDPLGGNPANPQSWNRYAYSGNDPINMSDPSGQDDCGSDPTSCTGPPVTGSLGSECNGSGICSGGTLTFGNLTSSASWANTGISVGDFWQYNDSYGGYVTDAASITACNSLVCGDFPITSPWSSGASSAETGAASDGSASSSQGGASLVGDALSIFQGVVIDHARMVAAYGMSGYLGLALGMHNPIGGFEDALEATASTAASIAGDHIVLGLQNFGLEDTASQAGGRTLLSEPDWQVNLQLAIGDPATRITVSLDGVSGASTYSQVMGAAQRGLTEGATPFNWEMGQLYQSGRLGGVTFMSGGQVVANPF